MMKKKPLATEIGKRGEEIACDYLKKRGYQILARNYRSGRNEIDVITRKDNVISFVEVKTRRNEKFGHPIEAVSENKQREILKAVQSYIHENPADGVDYRFDVIAIIENDSNCQFNEVSRDIFFIEDAFRVH